MVLFMDIITLGYLTDSTNQNQCEDSHSRKSYRIYVFLLFQKQEDLFVWTQCSLENNDSAATWMKENSAQSAEAVEYTNCISTDG